HVGAALSIPSTTTTYVSVMDTAPTMTCTLSLHDALPILTAVTVDSGLTVTDADSTNLTGATVTISSGLKAGDTLNFTNGSGITRSEEHTSELQSRRDIVCRLLLEQKKITFSNSTNDNPAG